ncbi:MULTISPECIES: hypothetical protein [Pseudomonas syringae group]|uniref:Uncharacterized protein n=1 Tax=Pseudomonas syringae group genomosp. 3 TaxID=251701 RepID=A0A2K4WA77_9PSED|nr:MULTISPECIES: hypothetical protein [Pseudomonas syringae group]MCF5198100.1 hypothetical protein [Pseudomonas syringae]MCF5209274.1 hypothetical protein [Pseudomonas syringae]MCF5215118.1 hypothetical protein [Pseudomonas syringae]MCF5220641.1 hypothetical protein [Pseudomonas syringae]MCF5263710.1 hypothetical protein [Pseudomonas syringae]
MMNRDLISYGATAFVDILGFSEKTRKANSFEDIEQIEKTILQVQDFFEHNPSNDINKTNHELYSRRVLAFSDCIIAHIPLNSQATQYSGQFDPILSVLVGLAYSQGMCVHNSHFVRGGVELGWWYHENDVLISQALSNAAKLEASANVPVIALCDDFYNYLANHDDRKTYHESIDPIPRLFRRYESEEISYYYLDYIGILLGDMDPVLSETQRELYSKASPEEKDVLNSQFYIEMCERWFEGHARIIESATVGVHDERVLSKYRWLSGYHNEICKQYTTKVICYCNLSD